MSIGAKFKSNVTDSFWFTPLVMGTIGIILAQSMVFVDQYLQTQGIKLPLGVMGVEGGRGILTAIAGSVLGVAATSFSITTAVLATASTTYGPRLVRNFMADSRNQFVLGSFGATFLYALMVLRAVRDATDIGSVFVPSIAINVAILFSVMNVVLLIYFIHHIADSIQISTLISRVRDDLIRSIESLYSLNTDKEENDEKSQQSSSAMLSDELPDNPPYHVRSQSDGFVTWVDYEAMARRAKEHNSLVKLLVQPGDYVFMGMVVAEVWQPRDAEDAEWPLISINTAQSRTPYQDIRYAVQQPVDITIRALSPGTNDPYTAINALRGLGSGLTRLCQRENDNPVIHDDEGRPRLHKKTITIEHMLDSVFRTLRSNVIGSVDATMAVLELAQNILETTARDSYRNIVIKAIHSIDDAFMDSDSPAADKEIIKNATAQIVRDHTPIKPETPHSPAAAEPAD